MQYAKKEAKKKKKSNSNTSEGPSRTCSQIKKEKRGDTGKGQSREGEWKVKKGRRRK